MTKSTKRTKSTKIDWEEKNDWEEKVDKKRKKKWNNWQSQAEYTFTKKIKSGEIINGRESNRFHTQRKVLLTFLSQNCQKISRQNSICCFHENFVNKSTWTFTGLPVHTEHNKEGPHLCIDQSNRSIVNRSALIGQQISPTIFTSFPVFVYISINRQIAIWQELNFSYVFEAIKS